MKNVDKNKTILVVAAHPDDEILGCGGTVARLIKEGFTAYTLILGEGIASRDGIKNKQREISLLKKHALSANGVIGVKEVFIYNFPDNKFDTRPLLDIVKVVENIKTKTRPDIIFTHYDRDLNVDHSVTFKAVITATRPLPGETVKEIYAFEVLSSTEWNYPLGFSPDMFVNIESTIEVKVRGLKEYKNELRVFPHPRSVEGVQINARYWGMKTGLKYAEAFKTIRVIR